VISAKSIADKSRKSLECFERWECIDLLSKNGITNLCLIYEGYICILGNICRYSKDANGYLWKILKDQTEKKVTFTWIFKGLTKLIRPVDVENNPLWINDSISQEIKKEFVNLLNF